MDPAAQQDGSGVKDEKKSVDSADPEVNVEEC